MWQTKLASSLVNFRAHYEIVGLYFTFIKCAFAINVLLPPPQLQNLWIHHSCLPSDLYCLAATIFGRSRLVVILR